jgi:hypothetical protein
MCQYSCNLKKYVVDLSQYGYSNQQREGLPYSEESEPD